ncbi:LysR family transcriptional regulator [Sphingomonas montanisoli]|uniref:LysR family transcriptional regulator n=1 Tax=Sphingomonas montanisoli TaxID=2606412 RepID=UPI002482560B|nr:LysR family transcriptional regulator [Sphingomonas montanisoli]
MVASLIRHLPFFAIAAEEENFQRAAVRLRISQPALSKRIQDLEASLGVRLFERSKGRVVLTTEGKAFAREAKVLLDGFDAAVRDLRRAAADAPELLTIGANEQAMRSAGLTGALRAFRDAHPEIGVTLSLMGSASQLSALKAGQVDAAILYIAEDDPAWAHSREIRQDDPFVIALPDNHALAGAATLRIADLAGEDLIWPSGDSSPALHADLDRAWRAAGVEPHVAVEILSAEAALNAVSAGLGIAVVRASNAGREPPGVVLRPIADLDIRSTLRLAWPPTPSRALGLFRDFLDGWGA